MQKGCRQVLTSLGCLQLGSLRHATVAVGTAHFCVTKQSLLLTFYCVVSLSAGQYGELFASQGRGSRTSVRLCSPAVSKLPPTPPIA